MSRNRKYIEQFDRNAGRPSDFDSLFHFEKNELLVKRRIKMKSARSRIAAMCSAAAVIGIAAFAALSYINAKGIASDTVMSRCTGEDISALSEFIAENSSSVRLSQLVQGFDYEVKDAQSDDALLVREYYSETDNQNSSITDWQAIMRFRVVSKQYSVGHVVYYIKPMEYYAQKKYFEMTDSNEILTFSVPAYIDMRELQTGIEYIMPFMAYNSTDNDTAVLSADNTGFFAQKTDKGWLIYSCKAYDSELREAMEADTEEVLDDIFGSGFYHLETSDEKMSEKLRTFLDSREETFYHVEFDSVTPKADLRSILPRADFEKVRYGADENGEPDRTLLVLDNEQYFSMMPYISGNVVFAGRTLDDKLCAAVEPFYNGDPDDEYYCRTILISGLTELHVLTGDIIDINTVIGVCSDEPITMRFIDKNGMPMEIELNDLTVETAVSTINE